MKSCLHYVATPCSPAKLRSHALRVSTATAVNPIANSSLAVWVEVVSAHGHAEVNCLSGGMPTQPFPTD